MSGWKVYERYVSLNGDRADDARTDLDRIRAEYENDRNVRVVGMVETRSLAHHTCENRLCVNPCHLAMVTRSEHPRLHAPDVCKRGHPRTPENVYANRACRMCAKMRRELVI